MTAVVSVIISIVAVAFSLIVFFDNQRKDRRDVFLRMHQLLIEDDLIRGRYLIFRKITDETSVQQLTEEEYRDINRALSTYNALGLYMANGYVRERDVMDMWAQPIFRAWRTAQPLIVQRERLQGYKPWKYFDSLGRKAEQELTRQGASLDFRPWHRTDEGTFGNDDTNSTGER